MCNPLSLLLLYYINFGFTTHNMPIQKAKPPRLNGGLISCYLLTMLFYVAYCIFPAGERSRRLWHSCIAEYRGVKRFITVGDI